MIERYLAQLAVEDPSFLVPADHQLGYELVVPSQGDTDLRPYWRTYYLQRAARLTGAAVAEVSRSTEPNTNRPTVLVELTQAGARAFAELTAEIAGKKLATIVDGMVKSAPVVMQEIRGGRLSIMMGGDDPERQTKDVAELVDVLKTGALPAPLREESLIELP